MIVVCLTSVQGERFCLQPHCATARWGSTATGAAAAATCPHGGRGPPLPVQWRHATRWHHIHDGYANEASSQQASERRRRRLRRRLFLGSRSLAEPCRQQNAEQLRVAATEANKYCIRFELEAAVLHTFRFARVERVLFCFTFRVSFRATKPVILAILP